uniref:uncharacterized protein n=1 Tax=Myxine glutinosa TaxID=7769 RepID=UPI00358EE993
MKEVDWKNESFLISLKKNEVQKNNSTRQNTGRDKPSRKKIGFHNLSKYGTIHVDPVQEDSLGKDETKCIDTTSIGRNHSVSPTKISVNCIVSTVRDETCCDIPAKDETFLDDLARSDSKLDELERGDRRCDDLAKGDARWDNPARGEARWDDPIREVGQYDMMRFELKWDDLPDNALGKNSDVPDRDSPDFLNTQPLGETRDVPVEDWDQEISEAHPHMDDIIDNSLQAAVNRHRLNICSILYCPGTYHVKPLPLVSELAFVVAGQFDDADEKDC